MLLRRDHRVDRSDDRRRSFAWVSITPLGLPVVPDVKMSSKRSSGCGPRPRQRPAPPSRPGSDAGRGVGLGESASTVDVGKRLEAGLARIRRVAAGADRQAARLRPCGDPLDRVGRHPQVERARGRRRPASPRSRPRAARASTATRSAAGRRAPGRARAGARRHERLRRSSSRKRHVSSVPSSRRMPQRRPVGASGRRRRRGCRGSCPSRRAYRAARGAEPWSQATSPGWPGAVGCATHTVEEAMADRILLLVGTKKGAFVVGSDQSRRAWQVSEPALRRLAHPGHQRRSEDGRVVRGRWQLLVRGDVLRSDDLGADVDPVERGPHLRRRRPEDRGRLECHALERLAVRRSRAGRPVPERGRRADLGPRRGPAEPPVPARPGSPAPAASSSTRSCPIPTDHDRMWVGHLLGRRRSRRRTAARPGSRATAPSARASSPTCTRDRPVRPQAGRCRPTATSGSTSRTIAASIARWTAAGRGTEITPGLPSEFGFAMTRPPARPAARSGTSRSRRPRRAATCPAAPRPSGGPTTVATPGSAATTGSPSTTPMSASCARRWPDDDLEPVGVYFGTSTGQLYGSSDGGVNWDPIVTTLPPIWSVEAVRVPG